jgi:hypothetical protein
MSNTKQTQNSTIKNCLAKLMAVFFVSLFSFASLAGDTYYTNADNNDNDSNGIPDNDMGLEISNGDVIHPVEFDIFVTGSLPSTSAILSITAFDVDEETGETNSVFINGNLLGTLSGQDSQANTSAFVVDTADVLAGANLVEVSAPGGRTLTVNLGQLLIDGGSQQHADLNSLDITNYTVSGTSVSMDASIDFDIISTGDYRIEVSIIDADDNNVSSLIQDISANAGDSFTRTYNPSYTNTNAGGTYTIQTHLFYDDGGTYVQQDYEDYSFLHVQNVGPNLPAAPAFSSISSASPSIVADGSTNTVITLQGIDVGSNNTSVSGQTVVLTTNLGSITSTTDQLNGTYTAVLYAATTAGTATVSATIDGDAVTNTASVTFLPGPASTSTTTITPTDTSLVANGVASTTITVQTIDTNNNDLITGGDTIVLSSNNGTLSGVTDLGNGRYTATLTSSTTLGSATINGTLNGFSIVDNAVVNFVVGTADPSTTTITSNLGTMVADGSSTSILTIQTFDANGNILIVGGDTLALSTTSGSLSAVTDNLDGSYSATLQSSSAASVANISGTLNAVSISDTETVTFVSRPTVNTLITNSATPTITGTLSLFAGATFNVQLGGQTYSIGDGNLSNSGSTWTLNIPGSNALADGNYSVTASITDSAAQVSLDTTSSELRVDLTTPTITFASLPSPGSSNVPNYLVSGTCSEIGATIDLSVTDTATASVTATGLSCTDNGSGTGIFSSTFDLSNLLDSVLTIQGDIEDDATNQSTSILLVTKNACVPDNTVAICDSDFDGIPNGIELAAGTAPHLADSDGDGISDAIELGADPSNPADFDDDGIIDALDSDSDNDLIPDAIEAGSTPSSPRDSDGDGIVDYLDRDSDNDHIPDVLEYSVVNVDPDSDGAANYIDLDSDGDGLPDTLENGFAVHSDLDNDQIDDAFDFDLSTDTDAVDARMDGVADNATLRDTDNDNQYDPYDSDADNDGIPDTVESALNIALDGDGDGIIDHFDKDATGRPDNNGDGLDDLVSALDSDGDGIPNYRDLDSDNDSQSDVWEAPAADISQEDSIIDNPTTAQASILSPADSDGDGIANYLDLESTNPLNNQFGPFDISANTDAATLDTNNDGIVDINTDTDGDGIPDTVDESRFRFGSALDPDADGLHNKFDLDDDNDGILDTSESEGSVDSDGDTWADTEDLDSDNDGLADVIESGAEVLDSNNDGFIDSLTDANNDGLHDGIALTNVPRNTDGDARADFRDIDSDADDLFDLYEAVAPGSYSSIVDMDNDGRVDLLSANLGRPSSTFSGVDSDADGSPDHADPDSDNDGYDDGQEDGDFNNDGINDRIQQATDKLDTVISGAGVLSPWLILTLLIIVAGLKRPQNLTRNFFQGLLITTSFVGLFNAPDALADSDRCAETLQSNYGSYFNSCGFVSFGLAIGRLEPEGSNSGWTTDNSTSYAALTSIGWHMTPHTFLELGYAYLGEAELSNASPVLDREVDAAISYKAPFLMAGYWFKSQAKPFNAFIKLGAAKTTSNANDSRIDFEQQSSTQLALGAGLQYRFSNSPWYTNIEYNSFAKDAASFGFHIGRYFGGSKPPRTNPNPSHKRFDKMYSQPVDMHTRFNDDDGDGITNDLDQCPHSIKGAKVNSVGCCSEENGCEVLFQDNESP